MVKMFTGWAIKEDAGPDMPAGDTPGYIAFEVERSSNKIVKGFEAYVWSIGDAYAQADAAPYWVYLNLGIKRFLDVHVGVQGLEPGFYRLDGVKVFWDQDYHEYEPREYYEWGNITRLTNEEFQELI